MQVLDRSIIQGIMATFEDAAEAREFVQMIVKTYDVTGAEVVERLAMAVREERLGDLKALAHKLKGMALNIGAVELKAACLELEEDVVACQMTSERAEQHYVRIKRGFSEVQRVLGKEFAS